MDNLIGRGFVYDVYEGEGNKVIKVPRSGKYKKSEEEYSFQLHQKYLEGQVAQSDFIEKGDSYKIVQEKINGTALDLMNSTNSRVDKILELGENLQSRENILFDIFGLEGMIKLFNYYFDGKALKAFGDMCLPINILLLKYFNNFPPELLRKMNKSKGNPFIAHNLLENSQGKITLIDTDYRPLDIMHPLNHAGNWITKKALKDIKEHRISNK